MKLHQEFEQAAGRKRRAEESNFIGPEVALYVRKDTVANPIAYLNTIYNQRFCSGMLVVLELLNYQSIEARFLSNSLTFMGS